MIILLPPSEGKKEGGSELSLNLDHNFSLPLDIAESSNEKDLKCSGKRFTQALELNKFLNSGPYMQAKYRYNGVMYKAIDYAGMSDQGQKNYEKTIRICSGLYGILTPTNNICNYKLPITTPLTRYWKKNITDWLNENESDVIVDLLSGAYRKMIDWKKIQAKIITINFLKTNGSRYTHGIKKIKGQWLKTQCESNFDGIGTIRKNSVNIMVSL